MLSIFFAKTLILILETIGIMTAELVPPTINPSKALSIGFQEKTIVKVMIVKIADSATLRKAYIIALGASEKLLDNGKFMPLSNKTIASVRAAKYGARDINGSLGRICRMGPNNAPRKIKTRISGIPNFS